MYRIEINKLKANKATKSVDRSICKDNNLQLDVRHNICFLKKTYTNGGVTYERGGTNETVCMNNAALSSLRNPDCKSASPPVNTVCYDCCTAHCPEDRFCNGQNVINPNYMPSYMKTVITTSAAVNGTKCLVCTEDQSYSCSSMDYSVCSGERPYCLNEIIYHNGNWTKTLHRCASRVECYWDYWIGTGNGTECIQNGVCTYCCQGPDGKPCNAMTEKPTNLTNFGQTQNRGI
ncbi:unnamed protein product [Mytilus coruscus]|uniref:Uncharacterized protein n=1 Tax=Mytilus coruscus TaxID=42192 RepID=A0A6J8E646_MYTCO|nr:unnamed protein product [Mytilus coruscus]